MAENKAGTGQLKDEINFGHEGKPLNLCFEGSMDCNFGAACIRPHKGGA